MTIEQINNDKNGVFKALNQDILVGELFYVWAGDKKFIIDHTDVNPNYNGKGVGKQMVMKAVEFARENNVQIIPLCPFAKSVFDKTSDTHDVLSK